MCRRCEEIIIHLHFYTTKKIILLFQTTLESKFWFSLGCLQKHNFITFIFFSSIHSMLYDCSFLLKRYEEQHLFLQLLMYLCYLFCSLRSRKVVYPDMWVIRLSVPSWDWSWSWREITSPSVMRSLRRSSTRSTPLIHHVRAWAPCWKMKMAQVSACTAKAPRRSSYASTQISFLIF